MQRRDEQPLLILDGGLATYLEDQGYDLNHRLWSARYLAEKPEAIRQVHRAYLLAGADIITTATYQATHAGFAACGYAADQVDELLRLAVELARTALTDTAQSRPGMGLVAASIGPYGASLADGSEYRGDYGKSQSELVDFHRQRWQVLEQTNPDVILCETIPSSAELQALVELACATDGPNVWISLSTSDTGHLADGTPLDECVRIVNGGYPRISGLGVNCLPPSRVSGCLRILGADWPGRLLAYPNSGETYVAASKSWLGERSPDDLADWGEKWLALGVSALGGCCRTRPEHIAALRKRLMQNRA